MNWTAVLEVVWKLLNSPAGVTAMAGLMLYLLNRLYARKPAWAKLEGAIISGVKLAEKKIPDGTPNKGLARLDTALKYVIGVYEEMRGRKPDAATTQELKEGVQIVHDKLEAAGTL